MNVPGVYLAYAPRGPGLMCALFYIVHDKDVYGWWIGSAGGEFPSAFFLLENFFSAEKTVLYATRGSDIYGGWTFDYSSSRPELDKPIPVDEDMCHELNRQQFAFASEWLFFEGARGIEEEIAAYGRQELAVQVVNVKSARLNKLNKDEAVWSYASPGFDMDILDSLMRKWPLDYKS